MTNAKLVTSPAEGHGLTNKLTDPLYSALANKRPTAPIVAIVVLKPVGLGQRETKNGSHQHVVFEATHLEPVTDLDEADTDDDGSDASDEGEEADTVGVACQVCNKKSKELTDGLCPKCAKNVGLPVASEHVPEPAVTA